MTQSPDEAVRLLLAAGYRPSTCGELAQVYAGGGVSHEVLRDVVWPVWRYRPDGSVVDPGLWREMFRTVGYQEDGEQRRRPLLSRRLYRGTAEHPLGMSWTTDHGVALHFARYRQAPGQQGRVWTAVVHPRRFLAHGTDEQEYVVDTRGLDVAVFDSTGTSGDGHRSRWPHRLRGS